MSTLASPLWQLLDHPIVAGDCVEVMAAMEVCCVDAVVCDPPYGLEFMGREWDRLDRCESADLGQRLDSAVARATRGTQPDRKRPPGEAGTSAKFNLPAPAFDLSLSSQKMMQRWHERWGRAAFRVLKPGGHLLAFGGTRTYHRLMSALEDAGFEIRDCLSWLYGQGFPKSLDAERAIAVKTCTQPGRHFPRRIPSPDKRQPDDHICPVTPESEPWTGCGTALRPGWEPIVVARKPLVTTVAACLLEHGTGVLHISACRLGTNGGRSVHAEGGEAALGGASANAYGDGLNGAASAPLVPGLGRWPANVVLSHTPDCRQIGEREVRAGVAVRRHTAPATMTSWLGTRASQTGEDVTYGDGSREVMPAWDCVEGCPVGELDAQSGTLTSGLLASHHRRVAPRLGANVYGRDAGDESASAGGTYGGDSGGASRFFYCAKADRAEREVGLEDMPHQGVFRELATLNNPRCRLCGLDRVAGRSDAPACSCPEPDFEDNRDTTRANQHPTVKPIDLMRWLIRLVTPEGALVLDPFAGSGTTGCAAALEGREFVGIERDEGYLPMARRRVEFWRRQPVGADVDAAMDAHAERRRVEATGQISLLG